ncbi:MAG TPA: L,D-transpeptidase family protein [Acidimicrobiales bacterium]|nr:L,D-transpeptidase family protein [Acidimicrobiales bacterium]
MTPGRRRLAALLVLLAVLLSGCSSSTPAADTSSSPSESTTTVPPSTAPPTTVPVLPPEGLGPGARGEAVRFVETRLDGMHFDVGNVDDVFDDLTTFGVQAFQKTAGLNPVDGRVTQPVLERLAGAQAPPPLVPGGGPTRVEIDLPRQVLFLYENDALTRVLPVSSGTGQPYCAKGRCGDAITPAGAFRVDYFKPGWDDSPLGELYNPVYFNPKEGIAIHGYPEVPPQPASHGCVRIPMAAAEWFHTKVPKGTAVYVIDGKTPVGPLAPGDPGAAGP